MASASDTENVETGDELTKPPFLRGCASGATRALRSATWRWNRSRFLWDETPRGRATSSTPSLPPGCGRQRSSRSGLTARGPRCRSLSAEGCLAVSIEIEAGYTPQGETASWTAHLRLRSTFMSRLASDRARNTRPERRKRPAGQAATRSRRVASAGVAARMSRPSTSGPSRSAPRLVWRAPVLGVLSEWSRSNVQL